MADLQKHETYSNTDYEILTEGGFKNFKGVIVGENQHKIQLTFDNGKTLICTPLHKIVTGDASFEYAENLQVGTTINNITLIDKQDIYNNDPVYEILDVEDTHTYYANDILSKQCLIIDEMAFVEPESILEDFWRSVFPTISRSKTSKVLIASTPNGTGNLFHRLYDGAEKGENGFVYEKVIWSDVPGRDEKWRNDQVKALGSTESFLQEFECVCENTLVRLNSVNDSVTIKEIYEQL